MHDPLTRRTFLTRAAVGASGVNRLSFPKWEVVQWTVPPRGDLPAIPFHWHNGRAPGSRELIERTLGEELDWGDKKDRKWVDHGGAVIVGTEGILRSAVPSRWHHDGHDFS